MKEVRLSVLKKSKTKNEDNRKDEALVKRVLIGLGPSTDM